MLGRVILRVLEQYPSRLLERFAGRALGLRALGPTGSIQPDVGVHDEVKLVEYDDRLRAEILAHPGDVGPDSCRSRPS